MARRRKSGLVSDIGTFAGGSMMIGAGALGTAAVGGDSSGLSTMGSMMSPLGSTMMMGHQVKMLKKIKLK